MARCAVVGLVVGSLSFAALAATNIVEVGETLKIESQEQAETFKGNHLRLWGTLDLNGFDVTVGSLSSVATNKTINGWAVGQTSALITNSAPGLATFTVAGGTTYYNGHVAPSVNFTSNGGELQILCDDQAFAPAKFTMVTASAMFLARATTIHFSITDVAADGESTQKLLRLAELMLTYKGIPVVKYNDWPLTFTTKGNWADLKATSDQYWDQNRSILESPAVFSMSVGSSGGTGAYGCASVDGYRIAPPEQPAYAPTVWEIYASRGENTGAILLDHRENDPLNRPAISSSTEKDNWSHRLSHDFGFNRLTFGSPIGRNTDVELGSGAALRMSTIAPFRIGNLSGQGRVQIDDGSVFAPTGLVGWTGTVSAQYSDKMGREAKFAISGSQSHAAFSHEEIVLVGGDENAEVVFDDSVTMLKTRLADGETPLNVTFDPGEGKATYLATQNAAYSGETKVASGTLSLFGPRQSVTCQYIRIAPKKVPSADSFHVYWAMNEFKVFDAQGQEIVLKDVVESVSASNKAQEWNGSTTDGSKLIDGDVTSRCLPYGDGIQTVTIKTKTPITFSSYDWYPSVKDGSPSKNRYPIELMIEVSSDGETWTVADYRTLVPPTDNADYCKYQGGDSHFGLCSDFAGRNFETLPAEFTGTTAADSSFVQTVKAQYIRFSPYETFYGGKYDSDTYYGWHVSEFSLMKNGEIVPWPAATTVGLDGCELTATSYGNALKNIADNLYPGCGKGEVNRCFVNQCGGWVLINANEVLEFDAYELWNGVQPSGYAKRLPRAWTVEVSMDKVNWHVIDNHPARETDVCPDIYGAYGPFSLKNRWPVNAARNAIGDESQLSVAHGATFDMASPFERVGGLSGLGSVVLDGATLALNDGARTPVFEGAVTGNGTLVLESGVQAFDNADLTGVTELAFAGGAFAGTARFGALKVTGDVKLVVPEALMAEGGSATLFTYDSIDAASKAALEAATFVYDFTGKRQVEIVVGEKSAVVNVRRHGMMLLVR